MKNKKEIKTIELFLMKTAEIRESSYVKFISHNKLSVTIKADIFDGISVNTNHPNSDAIKSIILTIRLFIQDKDGISLYKIEGVLNELEFDPKLIQKYSKARKTLKEFLDSTAVIYNGENLTYQKIFNVFLYGYFAHLDEKKYQIYQQWKTDQVFYESKLNHFLLVLNNIVKFLLFFEKSFRKELKKIKK